MKKIAAIALLVLSLMMLFPATSAANGTCDATSNRPKRVTSPSGVRFSGNIHCSIIHKINVTATLMRRSPKGEWLWWDEASNAQTDTIVLALDTSDGFNCAKDYKVVVDGWATDYDDTYTHWDIHSNGNTFVLVHTC